MQTCVAPREEGSWLGSDGRGGGGEGNNIFYHFSHIDTAFEYVYSDVDGTHWTLGYQKWYW